MVFYEGSVSYYDLEWMPLPELLLLQKSSERMIEAQKKEMNKRGR